MKGSKYLSGLVDVSMLNTDKLNIIKAPTGSGKTYFALNYIPSLTYDAIPFTDTSGNVVSADCSLKTPYIELAACVCGKEIVLNCIVPSFQIVNQDFFQSLG